MTTIYKYPLAVQVEMPMESKAVHVEWGLNHSTGNAEGWVWCEIDSRFDIGTAEFLVIGTGHPIPKGFSHLSTIRDGEFVWHLYWSGEA